MRAACGTGKTVMSRWSVERLHLRGGVAVIVCRSVALVAQTLRAWAAANDEHVALAVCGDETVEDSFAATADITEPVTTDREVVAKWLLRPSTAAMRLIVSTHVSAGVVGGGLRRAGEVADVLVVDEAHRTAGAAGEHTALVHDDDRLPATRRLYMTATPRIMRSGRRRSKRAATPRADRRLLSLDDETVFGPVLYRYPFSRGIAEGWLDDSRLAVIGVTRAEVLGLLRDAGRDSRADTTSASVHHAMVHAAIARAAKQYDLRRVLAFCADIADARQFADSFPATLAALPDEAQPSRPLHATHVHGGMSIAQRERVLDDLVEPPNGGWTVISNAKCLTEGVDVPAIDTVAFVSPKRSMVDIVQAVGRALRRNPHGNASRPSWCRSCSPTPPTRTTRTSTPPTTTPCGRSSARYAPTTTPLPPASTPAAAMAAASPKSPSSGISPSACPPPTPESSRSTSPYGSSILPASRGGTAMPNSRTSTTNTGTSASRQNIKSGVTASAVGLPTHGSNTGRVSERRVDALNRLDFEWEPVMADWFARYEIGAIADSYCYQRTGPVK